MDSQNLNRVNGYHLHELYFKILKKKLISSRISNSFENWEKLSKTVKEIVHQKRHEAFNFNIGTHQITVWYQITHGLDFGYVTVKFRNKVRISPFFFKRLFVGICSF